MQYTDYWPLSIGAPRRAVETTRFCCCLLDWDCERAKSCDSSSTTLIGMSDRWSFREKAVNMLTCRYQQLSAPRSLRTFRTDSRGATVVASFYEPNDLS